MKTFEAHIVLEISDNYNTEDSTDEDIIIDIENALANAIEDYVMYPVESQSIDVFKL